MPTNHKLFSLVDPVPQPSPCCSIMVKVKSDKMCNRQGDYTIYHPEWSILKGKEWPISSLVGTTG
jgi:hypothetical protein